MSNFKEHKGTLNSTKDLTGRFCERPFEVLEIHKEFYGFLCCPSWLPEVVGNCKTDGVAASWNSETAQKVRASILDGSFKYCDHLECPKIQSDSLAKVEDLDSYWKEIYDTKKTDIEQPTEIALCYDMSCNLACPSCRSEKIIHLKGQTYEEILAFTDQLIEELNSSFENKEKILLRVTGSGDPLASPLYFKLLRGINGKDLPNLKIILQTNAVMLNRQNWDRLSNIHQNIQSISVSIDAASKETYEKVRRLGNWDRLVNNLYFVSELKKENKIDEICLNYVVQNDNYFEMADFVKFAQQFEVVDEVFFSFVNDWGTWSKEEYHDQCIWKKGHRNFDHFMRILQDPCFEDPIVNLGNITEYRTLALKLPPPRPKYMHLR